METENGLVAMDSRQTCVDPPLFISRISNGDSVLQQGQERPFFRAHRSTPTLSGD